MGDESNNKFDEGILDGINVHPTFVPFFSSVLLYNFFGVTPKGLWPIEGWVPYESMHNSLSIFD